MPYENIFNVNQSTKCANGRFFRNDQWLKKLLWTFISYSINILTPYTMRVMLSISIAFFNRTQYILIVISLVGNNPSYPCVNVTRLIAYCCMRIYSDCKSVSFYGNSAAFRKLRILEFQNCISYLVSTLVLKYWNKI